VIENFWANALYSLAPTVLVGLIFWFVMYNIFRADRNERNVYAKIEAEERAKRAASKGDE
jgi:predicted permease